MSYPPRPPVGMPPMGMPFMGLPPGMPPPRLPVGMPPPGMGTSTGASAPPVPYFAQGGARPGMSSGGPPQLHNSGPGGPSRHNRPGFGMKPMDNKKDLMMPAFLTPPPNLGPPVTVFVGNITEKWPDAMIRQLLATCGQVLNWKRVQGAAGKLQGFGFCDFNGPDAGLRAVRLLHDLEVGDKKLVVKVDAKTNTVLEEFKTERKKKKLEEKGSKKANGESKESQKPEDDYMDEEMKEADEKSQARIGILFREFKAELEAYVPPGSNKQEKESRDSKAPAEDKLHLLKLSSLDKAGETGEAEDLPDEIVMDEGKREIISREILIFRENMKIEQQKEEERKKQLRERIEREKAREERRRQERERERSVERIRRDRSRSPVPMRGRRSNSRDDRNRRGGRDRSPRDRMDRGGRDDRDRRRRSRDRRSISPDRSAPMQPKPRYREREEEEEAAEQKRIERRAREKETAYEERLRIWEAREAKKAKEIRREKDKLRRQDEEQMKEARKMKQFLEDYDDEKFDSKYYKGKELQRRLADRAKELEADNKDRQREREELEEMKLRMLASGGSGSPGGSLLSRFDKYKKPMLDTTNTTIAPITIGKPKPVSALSANLNLNKTSMNGAPRKEIPVVDITKSTQRSGLDSVQFKPFVPLRSNSDTPTSLSNSPAVPQASPSVKSLTATGFQLNLNPSSSKDTKEPPPVSNEDSRNSFSPMPSPGMASADNSRDFDDFGAQDESLDGAPRRKKMDVKDVFNQDEDENEFGAGKKRKLVPLDFGDDKKSKRDEKIPEDKKKHIKSLIDKIPTDKDALFEYEIDWDLLDKSLMERRIRPWINKKIIDYIGEPEPTLVDFICSKVLARSSARHILEDVMMVLDDEAEVFVVKMWRLLVYELAAKKAG